MRVRIRNDGIGINETYLGEARLIDLPGDRSAAAAGKANKLVASDLSITEETVKGHVKSILSKLGANDRTQAVTLGLKRGIIEL